MCKNKAKSSDNPEDKVWHNIQDPLALLAALFSTNPPASHDLLQQQLLALAVSLVFSLLLLYLVIAEMLSTKTNKKMY